MTEPAAIVIAALGAAVVSGIVAIVSSALGVRSARQQIQSASLERERDRRHEVRMAIVQRRHDALEGLWELVFELERAGALGSQNTARYIRYLIWLPGDLQASCLSVLRAPKGDAAFASLRERLITEANAVPSEDAAPGRTDD